MTKLGLIINVLAGISITFLSGCYIDVDDHHNPDCKRGAGNISSETRAVPDFTEVSNSISGEIFVTQGTTARLVVKAHDNILDEIETTVSGGQLVIDSRRCFTQGEVQIFITMPEIRSISNYGSANVTGTNSWSGADGVDLFIAGSGNLEANIEANSVDISITGSGRVVMSGEAEEVDINITGSGEVEAFALESLHSDVKIAGSGNVEVFVKETLEGSITGSGNIYYIGTPDVNVSVTGSGAVRDAN